MLSQLASLLLGSSPKTSVAGLLGLLSLAGGLLASYQGGQVWPALLGVALKAAADAVAHRLAQDAGTPPTSPSSAPKVPPVVTGALLALALAGCTAAARSTAGGVVSTVAPFVPLICQAIPALQGSEACAETTQDIADAGKLVGGILTQFGDVKRELSAADLVPTKFRVQVPSGRSVDVTLPAWQAAIVKAKLGANA